MGSAKVWGQAAWPWEHGGCAAPCLGCAVGAGCLHGVSGNRGVHTKLRRCCGETVTLANSYLRAQVTACAAPVTCFWVQDGRTVALKQSLFMSLSSGMWKQMGTRL